MHGSYPASVRTRKNNDNPSDGTSWLLVVPHTPSVVADREAERRVGGRFTQSKMSVSVEKLVADNKQHGRCVGIEIVNKSHLPLESPQVYCSSGFVKVPPAAVIDSQETATCLFAKNVGFRGSVGLLSYKFGDKRVFLLFSNPYDFVTYSNEFALFIGDQHLSADQKLFDQMYRGHVGPVSFANLRKNGASISLKTRRVEFSATMSNSTEAIIKMQVKECS
ncbi:DELTA-thalatoxin-Avl1a-like [Arapaima gigas]